MVTQDRLKRIDIEPDYEIWKEWAVNEGIEACILSYLDIRKEDFYKVENTIDGRSFVTPRGWADLSNMIKLYKLNGIEVDELLIRQYLQDEKTTRQFMTFYELWNKYENDYRVKDILEGKDTKILIERAKKAGFDERLSLMGLLLDAEKSVMKEAVDLRKMLESVKKLLSERVNQSEKAVEGTLTEYLLNEVKLLREKVSPEKSALCSEKEQTESYMLMEYLKNAVCQIENISVEKDALDILKKGYNEQLSRLKSMAVEASEKLENLFLFCEQAFGNGAEMLIVVTELTSSEVAAKFIGQYGSEKYFQYNKELLFYERKKNVLSEIDELL